MVLDREALMRRYAPRLAERADLPTQRTAPNGAGDAVDLLNGLVEQIEERDEQDDQDQEPDHTGVMVAFFLDPDTAEALALGGDNECAAAAPMNGMPDMPMDEPMDEPDDSSQVDYEEADELHVTLAYLGQAGADISESQLPGLIAAVRGWAAGQQPIEGVTSGIGVFQNAEEIVTYASVDAPGLPAARQALIQALTAAGLSAFDNHGFTPHITLAYGDDRNNEVPRLPLTFDTVTVAFAGRRTAISLATRTDQATPTATDVAQERAYTSPRTATTARRAVTSGTWNPVVTTVGTRMVITAPATTERAAMWDSAPNPSKHMLWMQGRFVGAERPNRNGAFWSTADLELGKPTVTHGPLNWLHDEKRIIGTIADAKFVPAPGGGGLQVAMDGMGGNPACSDPHISALSAIWRWLYPDEASIVQMASDAQVLAYSMECISEAVQCVGDKGCGQAFPYMQYAQGKTCDHLQERSSVRRLVNPTFLGGAVIVPPTRPGWADADASVLRQAAGLAEKAYDQAGRPDIPAATWEQMMAGVLRFAQGDA